MNNLVLRKQIKPHLLLSLTVILLATMMSACSKKVQFIPSTVVPAATGTVYVKKDRNNNYAIDVKIDNLADPSRLESPKACYVVWVETEGNGTRNLGRLSVDSGLFSKALKGSLETVSPFKPVRFFITAEDEGNVQYPGMAIVLRSESYN
jgi:hypothetical protein